MFNGEGYCFLMTLKNCKFYGMRKPKLRYGGEESLSTCSCTMHRGLLRKAEDYWKSFSGIMHRIDSLAQDFNFKLVNNAVKIVAPVNDAKWIRWVDAGDDRVCIICQQYAQGGRGGYYHVTWFQPDNPHNGCRCEREILFYNPFKR